jgi:hypothetical protein
MICLRVTTPSIWRSNFRLWRFAGHNWAFVKWLWRQQPVHSVLNSQNLFKNYYFWKLNETVVMIQLTRNYPTCPYIGQKKTSIKLKFVKKVCEKIRQKKSSEKFVNKIWSKIFVKKNCRYARNLKKPQGQ